MEISSRTSQVKLSIIIPVYNEQDKIGRDIENACHFLLSDELSGEILVSDDNSSDQTAAIARNAFEQMNIPGRVILCEQHKGKGQAVRKGILAAQGDIVLFIDSGSCVPLSNVLQGIELIQTGRCEIAHASRKLKASRIVRPQSLFRRILSRLFHAFIIFYGVDSSLTDTQCGLKIYKSDVAKKLYRECRTRGFMFDIEIILRAGTYGYRIEEFPIEWTCDRDSRIHPIQKVFEVLTELFQIKKIIKQIENP